jgi:ferredoxin
MGQLTFDSDLCIIASHCHGKINLFDIDNVGLDYDYGI